MERLKTKCGCCGTEADGLSFVRVPDGLLNGWLAIAYLADVGWRQKALWGLHVIGSLLFSIAAIWFWLPDFIKNPEWWRIATMVVAVGAVEQGLLRLFLKSDIRRFKTFASSVAEFLKQNEGTLPIERNEEFTVFPIPTLGHRPTFLVRDDGSVRVNTGTWYALVPPHGETHFSWGTAL